MVAVFPLPVVLTAGGRGGDRLPAFAHCTRTGTARLLVMVSRKRAKKKGIERLRLHIGNVTARAHLGHLLEAKRHNNEILRKG